jgi:hypothetical protein
MGILSDYIQLLEDDSSTTNVVGDGNGAVKLYAPSLGKKLATHGLVEGDMDEPVDEQMKIPTSPDDPPKQIYDFLVAQKKASDPEDG